MSNLEKGQECFLHKGTSSEIFVYGTVEYQEAIKDGWVSDKAEAKRLFQEEIVKKTLEEEAKKKEELARVEMKPVKDIKKYRKKILIEVVAVNSVGDVLVQNEGDSSDRWEIKKEIFNESYEVVEDTGKKETKTKDDDIDIEKANKDLEEVILEDLSVKELRAICKKLKICCVNKSNAKEIIEKINKKLGKSDENKDNSNT